jgi:hypothetical protein
VENPIVKIKVIPQILGEIIIQRNQKECGRIGDTKDLWISYVNRMKSNER